MDSIPEPDDKRLFHLFRQCGMDEDGAYTAVQEIRTMAGQNVIAEIKAQGGRLEGRLDVLEARQAADKRELQAEIRVVNRTLAVGSVALGLLITVLQFLAPLVR